jgi:hypothetical protein
MIQYWQMAFGREPIPNVIHIDVPQAPPSQIVRLPTSFVMTLEVMPTLSPVNSDDDPDDDDSGDDGECWKYVGVDMEPINSDALDESSDSDEDAAPGRRSIAGRISLHGNSSLLPSGLSKRAGRKVDFINKIGNCATAPNPNVIVRAELHPGPRSVMKAFDMQGKGNKKGLDPNMYCE